MMAGIVELPTQISDLRVRSKWTIRAVTPSPAWYYDIAAEVTGFGQGSVVLPRLHYLGQQIP
jgi:hypothetical protein